MAETKLNNEFNDWFLIMKPIPPSTEPWVMYVSDPNSPEASFVENLGENCLEGEGRERRVLLAINVHVFDNHPRGHVPMEEAPAIRAIAALDAANWQHRPNFRRALAKVFEMGMEAQRELTRREEEEKEKHDKECRSHDLDRD